MPGVVVFMHKYMWVFESVCLYRINRKNELMNSEFKVPLGSATISMCSGEEGERGSVGTNFYHSNRMLILVEHINTKCAKYSTHNY